MNLKHYLLTRFKLRFDSEEINKRTDNDKWFQDRIEIFNSMCYPSIISQTNQNFTWLVFSTEGFITSKEKRLLESYKGFKNIYCTNKNVNDKYIDVYDDLPSRIDIFNEIKKDVNEDDYILTTRIDTDDALNKRFVDVIQKAATGLIESNDIPIIISPERGLRKNGNKFSIDKRSYTNAYISVVDKFSETCCMVYDHPHIRYKHYLKTHYVKNDHMFIQGIYGENNIFSGKKGIRDSDCISNKVVFQHFTLGE